MAISQVGELAYTLASGAGTENKTLPGTVLEGDVVFVFQGCDEATRVADITTSGYVSVIDTTNTAPGRTIAYKIMTSTPDTIVTITRDGTVMTAGIIKVWRGVDTTTVLDNGAATTATNTTGDPDAPSYTTITNNALLVAVGVWDDDDTASSVTYPSGYSNGLASDTGQASTTVGATVTVATKLLATAGADDPSAFGGTGDDAWWGATFALRPLSSSPITGTLSATLGALTASSTSQLAILGTSSSTLGALTVSSTSKLAILGTSSSTLGALTLSSSAKVAILGTASATLGALTVSSEGDLFIVGTATNTLGALTVSSDADLLIAGTLTGTLGALTLSAAGGATPIVGTLTSTLGALTLSSDADLLIGGTLSATLGALTVSSTGALPIVGTLSATLADVTVASNADLFLVGTLTATLADLTASTNADLLIGGTLSATLGSLTLSSEADLTIRGTLTATLGALTLSASGGNVVIGSVNATLGNLTLSSSATVFYPPITSTLVALLDDLVISSVGELEPYITRSGYFGKGKRLPAVNRSVKRHGPPLPRPSNQLAEHTCPIDISFDDETFTFDTTCPIFSMDNDEEED